MAWFTEKHFLLQNAIQTLIVIIIFHNQKIVGLFQVTLLSTKLLCLSQHYEILLVVVISWAVTYIFSTFSPEFCEHWRRETCWPNGRVVGRRCFIFPVTVPRYLKIISKMSSFHNDFVVFETLSETVPYPGLTSTVALKLYSGSKYLGEPLRSIILKIGMVSESVSWPLIWYLKRSLACGNSRHTIFSLLLNTMNMTTLKIHRVISLGHRLIFLTETV